MNSCMEHKDKGRKKSSKELIAFETCHHELWSVGVGSTPTPAVDVSSTNEVTDSVDGSKTETTQGPVAV